MKIHVPKCHVCKKQVGQPYAVRPRTRIAEVLCFECPDDTAEYPPKPSSRTAGAVRKPLPKPRKQLDDDRWRDHVGNPDGPPDSLAETIMPAFGDEWSTFND